MTEKFLSVRQAAAALGIRLDATYSLVWAGKLAAEKKDGRWRVPARAVESRLGARQKVPGQQQGQPS